MIRCLNFHAAYRCRHAGACCRAGWTIPFDSDERQRVEALRLPVGAIVAGDGGSAVAARDGQGVCSFYAADAHRCAIHRAAGPSALPVPCRMFPRSVLHDARGTFISLSHYCPTAAALLFEPGPPVTIVDAPSSLYDVGPLDGLDARDAWPPLVRPGVLMDLESYGVWERRGVELLTREGVAPEPALAALERAAARVAAWTVEDAPLVTWVGDAFAAAASRGASPAASLTSCQSPDDVPVKRWLASRLFACWIAYQGDGVEAIARYLRGCLDTFAGERARSDNALEAIRRSDFRIMHRP